MSVNSLSAVDNVIFKAKKAAIKKMFPASIRDRVDIKVSSDKKITVILKRNPRNGHHSA